MSKYTSFAELLRHERPGRDFRIVHLERSASPVFIVAPHGGEIEAGTSEIAGLIAGTEHSLFCFEGLKCGGDSRDLHITSHLFDHPECIALAARRGVIVSVHGCKGDARVFVGGLDRDLGEHLARRLSHERFEVVTGGHEYPGRHPSNICNRGSRSMGAQLEITHDLRAEVYRGRIAAAVRAAIADFLASDGPGGRAA